MPIVKWNSVLKGAGFVFSSLRKWVSLLSVSSIEPLDNHFSDSLKSDSL